MVYGKELDFLHIPPTFSVRILSKLNQMQSFSILCSSAHPCTFFFLFFTFITFLILLCRKRRPNDRGTGDNIQLEPEWTNNASSTVSFDNPGFREDVIYDTISAVTGRAIEANLKQAKQEGFLELRIPAEEGNRVASKLPLDDRNTTYEPLSVAGRSNPTYALASRAGEDLPEQYATLQEKGTSYEALRPNTVSNGESIPLHDDHEEYLKPIEAQTKVPGDNADDDHYMNLNLKEESQA